MDFVCRNDERETKTVEKVQETTGRVRHQINELLNQEKEISAENLTNNIHNGGQKDNLTSDDVERTRPGINHLPLSLEKVNQSNKSEVIAIKNNEIDRHHLKYIILSVSPGAISFRNAYTVAGGHGQGNKPHQLFYPYGLYVEDDRTILIADGMNHRIVEWKCDATTGQVVAGGNGQGNGENQLNRPTDVIVDKKTDSVIICDSGNRRIMQWPRRNGKGGNLILSNIDYSNHIYSTGCQARAATIDVAV
ncbi:unnamed protein product [Rotaria sp. Silwood1]|nr:unnamed protein product [Rotaria sp. Silwood1]